MLSTLLVLLTLVYSILMVAFAIAAARSRHSFDRSYRPSTSVVIAARNEESNIRQCLDSMIPQTYPKDRLEIIVVDDQSSDRTPEIVIDYSKMHSHVRLIRVAGNNDKLRGKANALNVGIRSSVGEILLFTDADCVVPKGWVEETVKYYAEPSVGLVAGFTFLKSSSLFEHIQALDWFAQFTIAAGAIRLGFPITAVGNNLSVRRTAYDKAGGFDSIPFSVTEDHALFHAITTTTGFTSRFPLDSKTLVQSQPCRTITELYWQKKRWFAGGLNLDRISLTVFGGIYLFKLLLIGVSTFHFSLLTLFLLCLTFVAEVILTIPPAMASNKLRSVLSSPFFFFYLTAYTLLFPPIVFAHRQILWKDRKYP